MRFFTIMLSFLLLTVCPALVAEGQTGTITIDAILATVDGDPVTLSDLNEALGKQGPVSFNDVKNNIVAERALDGLINEKLMQFEIESRKLRVGDEDVDNYIIQVAQKNNLDLDGFKAALATEGKSFEDYKRQVHFEIMRSKLASDLIEEGGGVTDVEVTEYIEKNYGSLEEQNQVHLRQIVFLSEKHSEAEATEMVGKLKEKIEIEKMDFKEAVVQFSESPDAHDGGDLGVLAEKDLSPEIFEAILTLKEGEISAPVKTAMGVHIFLLEERFDSEDSRKGLEVQARKALDQQKMETKFQLFFTEEIFKKHTVERKYKGS